MATAAQLRSAVAGLTSQANRDLAGLWRSVETAVRAREALNDVLPALVDQYGTAAAALAATWYDEIRAKQGAVGAFEAPLATIPNSGEYALVGWALETATDYSAFQTLIAGGVQRRIANYSRLTVMRSSVADPSAIGWRRVGDGSSCPFCSMLLSRGAVYREDTADFQAHDHCGCTAVPEFA